jgi:hypothetical protein
MSRDMECLMNHHESGSGDKRETRVFRHGRWHRKSEEKRSWNRKPKSKARMRRIRKSKMKNRREKKRDENVERQNQR